MSKKNFTENELITRLAAKFYNAELQSCDNDVLKAAELLNVRDEFVEFYGKHVHKLCTKEDLAFEEFVLLDWIWRYQSIRGEYKDVYSDIFDHIRDIYASVLDK